MGGWGRDVLERGGGSGTQNFVYQKWPNQLFPTVNFGFSHEGPFGLGGGGGRGVPPPAVVVVSRSNTSLASAPLPWPAGTCRRRYISLLLQLRDQVAHADAFPGGGVGRREDDGGVGPPGLGEGGPDLLRHSGGGREWVRAGEGGGVGALRLTAFGVAQGCIRRDRTQKRLGRRLPKRLWGGYCRLQMPLKLALGVRGTVAGLTLGAPDGGYLPPFQCIPGVASVRAGVDPPLCSGCTCLPGAFIAFSERRQGRFDCAASVGSPEFCLRGGGWGAVGGTPPQPQCHALFEKPPVLAGRSSSTALWPSSQQPPPPLRGRPSAGPRASSIRAVVIFMRLATRTPKDRGGPVARPGRNGQRPLRAWAGTRARSLYATPPPPPRDLKDSGPGSVTGKTTVFLTRAAISPQPPPSRTLQYQSIAGCCRTLREPQSFA